jgi:hypothetical protein
MAGAGKITIAEVKNFYLQVRWTNEIHIPGIMVQRASSRRKVWKRIEQLEKEINYVIRKRRNSKTYSQRSKKDGYINLGIGIPTLVANYVRTDIAVEFQSENGVGMGPFPLRVRKMLISSTQGNKRSPLTQHPFDSALSFNDLLKSRSNYSWRWSGWKRRYC